MGKGIKTRSVADKTIKAIDKAAVASERMKEAYIRTKDKGEHVGIVEKVENGRVYTVEGNSGDSVRQNSYPVGYYEIYGYGTPAY